MSKFIRSCTSVLPEPEQWVMDSELSSRSVHYAQVFRSKILSDNIADKFSWRKLTVDPANPSTVCAWWEDGSGMSMLLNFMADGECSLHVTYVDLPPMQATCHLDQASDWMAIQTIADTVNTLVK